MFLCPNGRMPWACLLVERVLYLLLHDFQICYFETQTPLVLGFPRPRPLYDGIAGLVLQYFRQRRSFLVLPTPYNVLVDLDL